MNLMRAAKGGTRPIVFSAWHPCRPGAGNSPLATLVVVGCLCLSGCGEKFYSVSLAVRLPGGKPAAGCSVILEREQEPKVRAGGRLGPDGVCTPFVAGRSSPGLLQGTYRVGIAADAGPPTDGGGRRPLPFDAKFTDPNESGLRVEVGPGRESAVTLSLEP